MKRILFLSVIAILFGAVSADALAGCRGGRRGGLFGRRSRSTVVVQSVCQSLVQVRAVRQVQVVQTVVPVMHAVTVAAPVYFSAAAGYAQPVVPAAVSLEQSSLDARLDSVESALSRLQCVANCFAR